MKVFCSNCIFYFKGERIPFPFADPKCFDKKSYNVDQDLDPCEKKEKCLAPQNFKNDYEQEKKLFVSVPSVINQFNTCNWYIPKGEDSSSSSSSSSSSD